MRTQAILAETALLTSALLARFAKFTPVFAWENLDHYFRVG